MACTEDHVEKIQSELESKSDSKEVFPNLSHPELESCLSEILEKYQKLHNKYKDLKQVHVSESQAHNKLKKDFSILNEEKFILKMKTLLFKVKVPNLRKKLFYELMWILKLS